jgi:hypothetical protein
LNEAGHARAATVRLPVVSDREQGGKFVVPCCAVELIYVATCGCLLP